VAQLQRPELAYMNGSLVQWDKAVLHVGCEAVTRGLNVFEGLKAYWQADGSMKIAMARQHYDRLRRSAKLLHMPCPVPYDEYVRAIDQLISALAEPHRDMWARTTLFGIEGQWGEDTVSDLILTAYHQDKSSPVPIRMGVSTWRRSADIALPPRIKTGSNYEVSRLARIEGRVQGCDDMILLNSSGRVAEATASCILMVRSDTVYTPPPTEGALESITVDVVESLAASLGIAFVRRPIDRTELLIADELAICGTLHEITLVKEIEKSPLPEKAPVLGALRNLYLDAMRGTQPHSAVEMVALSSAKAATK
jgi:branched-chain amino acid aminotransferase